MVTFNKRNTKEKKHIDLIDDSLCLSSSTVFGTSEKFAVNMSKHDPRMIKNRAGKSYLQMSTSFKKISARTTWNKIAVAELNDSSTISAKGVTPILVYIIVSP